MSDVSDRDGSIPENKEVVVVWSGGLDSTSLIAMMIKDYTCGVYPLFINRGQGNYRFEKIRLIIIMISSFNNLDHTTNIAR
jgi:7-cyano-7-deazaguanine synthase in queuosine biosynthesis